MSVGALILAAGESRRMGQPKINLPWGRTTVLGQIIQTVLSAKIQDCWVILGKHQPADLPENLAAQVKYLPIPQEYPGEMLTSLQWGLENMPVSIDSVMVFLGDQPQLQLGVVKAMYQRSINSTFPLIMPSYNNRRGHPWVVRSSMWPKILALGYPETMRSFFRTYETEIDYLEVETETILQDLDTYDDYLRYRPEVTEL
jgi:molybdenum cofactor cytidylyltransferase